MRDGRALVVLQAFVLGRTRHSPWRPKNRGTEEDTKRPKRSKRGTVKDRPSNGNNSGENSTATSREDSSTISDDGIKERYDKETVLEIIPAAEKTEAATRIENKK